MSTARTSSATDIPIDADDEIARLRRELAEERAARAAERERAELAHDFLENGSIGLHCVGPDGTILWANRTELDLLGYAREEYVGRNIVEFHADRGIIDDILCRLTGNQTLVNYEARLRCRDGSVKTVLINSNVLWRDGAFVHTRCFTRDVTEMKRQALAVRESEERYRTLIAQANDAIVVADAETGIILDANERAGQLFALPADRLIGMHQTRLHPPEKLEEYAEIFREHAAAGGGRVVKDLLVRDAAGRDIPVEISANVIPLAGRRAVQGIFRDMTERKRIEAELAAKAAELARSNAELEMFAATASHDLQEPLRMISSYASLLQGRYAATFDERANGYFRHITGATDRMASLVKALLHYARVGQGGIVMELVPMLTALREATDNMADKIAGCRATVSFDELPAIVGNRVMMVQLLQNLIGNAIKFCDGRDPNVRIEGRDTGAEWTFTVADNGIGIDPRHHGRIFDAFQRLNAGARFAGTGLGLATCRKIVDLHRGRIWVESTPGIGSMFSFSVAKP